MSEVKHRKHRSNFSKTAPPGGTRSTSTTGKRTVVPPGSSKNEEDTSGTWTSSSWLHLGICLIAMVYCGYKHAELMYTIHENNMWFSNIKVTSYYNRDVQLQKLARGSNKVTIVLGKKLLYSPSWHGKKLLANKLLQINMPKMYKSK